jgi:Gas vesicle synthesis protein GvpO
MAQTREGVRRRTGAADIDDGAAVERDRPARRRASEQGSDGRNARSKRSGAQDPAPPGSQAHSPRPAVGKARESGLRERAARSSLAARQVAGRAAAQVSELTGRDPESVISVARDGDNWQVGVEVVEMHRIPDSADIMAIYHVHLGNQGEMLKYHRECRYIRGSTEGVK